MWIAAGVINFKKSKKAPLYNLYMNDYRVTFEPLMGFAWKVWNFNFAIQTKNSYR